MQTVLLWERENVPLFDPAYGDFIPYMEIYPLEGEKNAPAVLVIPGGAYAGRSEELEGRQICRYLNENGFAAAVLMYRVAPYAFPVMLLDAQRAIRTLRYRAGEWGLDPERIGTMGFSAGGHLCCLTATCFDDGQTEGDAIDAVSCRINTAAPCYAVASFDPAITHMGTRENFLGKNGDETLAELYSPENMVREDMPPVFLWHTAADDAVNPECSLRFASALIRQGVPCELHVFPYGAHGADLAVNLPLADQWPALYVRWLRYYN